MPPVPTDGDPSFADALDEAFEATDAEVRAVARLARDLDDSGRYRADTSRELTPHEVVEHLDDSPDDRLHSKWNWWVGSLELAYGDYAEFRIQAFDTQ